MLDKHCLRSLCLPDGFFNCLDQPFIGAEIFLNCFFDQMATGSI